MNKNDILRRIRYVFDFSDSEMISIFAQADHLVPTWRLKILGTPNHRLKCFYK